MKKFLILGNMKTVSGRKLFYVDPEKHFVKITFSILTNKEENSEMFKQCK